MTTTKKHKCKDITELISLQQEQPLAFKQKLAMQVHLMICPYCRAFRRNNEQMRKLMQQFKDKSE